MTEYREEIYKNYASEIQEADHVFDPKSAERWGKAYNYYLRDWLPENKNAEIVDLACGGGKLLFYLKSKGYSSIQGVDISPSQINLAKQVVLNVEERNILEYLLDHPQKFDCITGLDIIEHFNKNEVICFLKRCYSAMKPGGRLIIQTPNADSPFCNTIRYGDFTHEVCFNPLSLKQLLKQEGFEQINIREQGPIAFKYSIQSTLRCFVWNILRAGLMLFNFAETGSLKNKILTRTFIISAIKHKKIK